MEHMLHALEARRLMSAGDIDRTFFGSGSGIVQFGQRSVDTVFASMVQSDGKVLIVGSTNATDGNGTDLAVARLNPDATLDQSFGETLEGGVGGGLFELPFPTNSDNFFGVDIQTDGKVVVAGSISQTADDGTLVFGQAVVIRLMPNGTPDFSFGLTDDGEGAGFVLVPLSKNTNTGLPNSEVRAVGIQSTGKIVLGGTADVDSAAGTSSFAIARLNTDGSLDTSFGEAGTGIDVEPVPGLVTAILALDITPDDRIVFTGTAVQPSDGVTPVIGLFVTARTLENGIGDNSFGDEGVAVTVFADSGTEEVLAVPTAVKVQPDGKTLVAGFVARSNGTNGPASRIALVRYNVDGSLDTSFGGGASGAGTVETSFPENGSEAYLFANQIRLRADGSFFIAGRAAHAFSSNLTGSVVARYRANGTLDTTFSQDGITLLFGDASISLAGDVDGQFGNVADRAGALVEEIPGGGILILASNASGDLQATRLVADGPDLVSTVTVIKPGSFLGGAKGSAQVKLSNQGSAAFVGTVPVKLLLSTDATLSDDDLPMTTLNSKVKLTAGQSGKATTVKFNYPKGESVSGQYFVLVSANEGRGLTEGNFLNNSGAAATPVNVNPAFVDLGATLIGSPLGGVPAGKKGVFSVQLVNNGNVPAAGSITLQLLASSDDVFGDDRLLVGSKLLKVSLKPGNKTQKFTGTVPADLAAGTYVILLNLDASSLSGRNPVRQSVTAMTLTVV